MTKRKLTKYEDDVRRNLRNPAEINPAQSPHKGIHTCSKGCKKAGCNRGLRDTIEEQDAQIVALKRDLLEKTAAVRSQFANSEQENARLNNYIERLEVRNAELVPENARLKAEVERLTSDWQKANNEVYGLQTQVAALIDDQTRLKAEVERLRASSFVTAVPSEEYERLLSENKLVREEIARLQAEVERLRKVGDEMAELFGGDYSDIDGVCYDKKWNAAKEGKQS